ATEIGRWEMAIDVAQPVLIEAPLSPASNPREISVAVHTKGRPLIEYDPGRVRPAPAPTVAAEPKPPEQIESLDELYLTGLHLEQYRHATRMPDAYWAEGLRREPNDSRLRNAMG